MTHIDLTLRNLTRNDMTQRNTISQTTYTKKEGFIHD